MKQIYIVGNEDFNNNALKLETLFKENLASNDLIEQYEVKLVLKNHINDNYTDMQSFIDSLVKNESTKGIIFTTELSSLKEVDNKNNSLDNLLSDIRKERKDIFVVGFKSTTNNDSPTQYLKGLKLLKENSINLVLVSDTINNTSMIVAPEETRYCETKEIDKVLKFLATMTLSRMQNKFTRSTVVEGQAVNWLSDSVPDNLREVVNHCIEKGAYKPFLGKTAGHFAVKVNEGEILTSIRKTNFNELDKVGLVKVQSKNEVEVIAHGFKPSVGGQSQRIIFKEHPDLDCIVHFHCPVKEEYKEKVVPVKAQWPNECGSHQCGKNTSDGLKEIDVEGHKISVVYLDEHGPNIVFNRQVPAQKVIDFIDKHFDLSQKTGGFVEAV